MSYLPCILVCLLFAPLVVVGEHMELVEAEEEGWFAGNCSLQLHFCEAVTVCEEIAFNHSKHFRCRCPDGVPGNGVLAEYNGTGCDQGVIPCTSNVECPAYSTCNLSVGNCQCDPGFFSVGKLGCNDTNECDEHPCHENAFCTNSPGSFQCTCDFHNDYEGNGTFCQHRCDSDNQCHKEAVCNSDDRICVCNQGYEGTGVNCTDKDECQDPTSCPQHADCINEVASFQCICHNGYYTPQPSAQSAPCIPAPTDCEDIRLHYPHSGNGFYIIDPDFNGTASLMEVFCEFRGDYAITEVRIQNKQFPIPAVGVHDIDYGADYWTLQKLLENSYYCTQLTQMDCDVGFDYNMDFMWMDAYNNTHTSWAGASRDGMCACGEVKKCHMCNCGGHTTRQLDKGYFTDKTQLAVMHVRLGNDYRGALRLGPLRCAPRVFDIPTDCDGYKSAHNQNGPYLIDVDGPLGSPPFLVYCDLQSFGHVGVTEVQLDQNTVSLVTHNTVSLSYVQGLDLVEQLVSISTFCTQHVQYTCQNSGITGGRVYVSVTSAERQLPYFPGANGVNDSCACGATQSCPDKDLRCVCDTEDGRERSDYGDIIALEDMPVVGVTGGTEHSVNTFFVSHLRCAPRQFGIPANCEKLRSQANFEPLNSTYFIDPDGLDDGNNPQGNVKPYLVECRFSHHPPMGITVVHHTNETLWNVAEWFNVTYLQADDRQLQALKARSTFCTQSVEIGCNKFSLTTGQGSSVWTGLDGQQYTFDGTLSSCVDEGQCQCDGTEGSREDSGLLSSLEALPVTSISFGDIIGQLSADPDAVANITVGPLQCSELFPTCADLHQFVTERTDLGETLPDDESPVTIDADGSGDVSAFSVRCQWPTNTIVHPSTPGGTLTTTGPDDKTECFDIVYTDEQGTEITPEQLVALRDASESCFQELWVDCRFAQVHGLVNFTTCDGQTQPGWAGSAGKDSCACGVGGHCDGGSQDRCNCDMEDGQQRRDGAVIIKHERLPVCQVCGTVKGIPSSQSHVIQERRLEFRVSPLNCHPGQSRFIKKTCQEVSTAAGHISQERTEIVYMNHITPVPVGCVLRRPVPFGQLEVVPVEAVHRNVSGTVEVEIKYYSLDINVLRLLMLRHVYCTQRVYFFCLASDADVDIDNDNGWLDGNGNLQHQWHTVDSDDIDTDTLCERFSELCERCGPPKEYVVYDDHDYNIGLLPITGLRLSLSQPATVVVDRAHCTDVYKSCQSIMTDSDQRRDLQGMYPIDPDGAGGVDPFSVECSFALSHHCAVSKVFVTHEFWNNIGIQRHGMTSSLTRDVTYGATTVDQIKALADASHFCWQPVKFDCLESKLVNDNSPVVSFYSLSGQDTLSFGTGNRTDHVGCACSLTGTCKDQHTCNCDAGSNQMLLDEGIVSKKTAIPVTKVTIGQQTSHSSSGTMSVGNVMCSNNECRQFPRDCQEALGWGHRHGINFRKNGEYMIQPNPGHCQPFLVYCEMDLSSNIGLTKIMSRSSADLTMNEGGVSQHAYYVPTMKQMQCLKDVSPYCAQPVVYDCFHAPLLGGGAFWLNADGEEQRVWGGGSIRRSSCACAVFRKCGGNDTRSQQRSRKCNCDFGDQVWRKDAGVFTEKSILPLTTLNLDALQLANDSQIKVTIGPLYCSQQPIQLNECKMGYHDCHEKAKCQNKNVGYSCSCLKGWQGKHYNRTFDKNMAVANGRECIDDDECSFNLCPVGISDCVNTAGSFHCICHEGYVQTGHTTCEDVNECKNGHHNCDDNARCINQQGNYTCLCHRNYRGNGYKGQCRRVGICTMFGDPHTYMFDGVWNHYQGKPECQYVAATDDCDDDDSTNGTFKILVTPFKQEPPMSGTGLFSWVKEVHIMIEGMMIDMLQGRDAIVDGVASQGFSRDGVVMYNAGRQLVMQTVNGLEVYWDGNDEVEIVAPSSYQGKLCGLCGNMDGDDKNDWMIGHACNGSGNVTDNQQLFGQSWTYTEGPNLDNEKCLAKCMATKPKSTCILDQASVEFKCNQIYDMETSPFKKCLKMMDKRMLKGMIESCEFDVCRVRGNPDPTVCYHASAVAEYCQQSTRVDIGNWRSPEFCSMECKENMEYKTCENNERLKMQTSCLELRAPDLGFNNILGCLEGCYCKEGLVEEGSDCVKEEDCGCFYNGSYVKLGAVVTDLNCSNSAQCTEGGTMVDVVLNCGQHQTCGLQDNVVGCHCVDGYIMVDDVCVVDPCLTMTCMDHAECHRGECRCLPGFMQDCDLCHDIDECDAGLHDCYDEGEFCNNTVGSFECDCKLGYRKNQDGFCEDVDECTEGLDHCPPHSQCHNKAGKYGCMCCLGYSLDDHAQCVLDNFGDAQYVNRSDVPDVCCDCPTPDCDKPGPVCGSDGVTYPNIRALVVQTCLKEKKVHPMYEGECQGNCSQVICSRAYATCDAVIKDVAVCGCPTCPPRTDIQIVEAVCGSDLIIYRTQCEFEAAMCASNIVNITILNTMQPCLGEGNVTQGNLTEEWTQCSTECGQGSVYTTVTNNVTHNSTSEQHNVTAVCFSFCETGTCEDVQCEDRHECVETAKGPQCTCPRCGHLPRDPVCGQVGRSKPSTFRSLCDLKEAACLRHKPYYLLDNEACQLAPISCRKMNFYEQRDIGNKCKNEAPMDYGRCSGGCDDTGDCCFQTKVERKTMTFACPDGSTQTTKMDVIKECGCVPRSEVPPDQRP